MNTVTNAKRVITLIFGDIAVYLFSLILTLAVRYGELPTRVLLADHLPSFSALTVLFVAISFIAGLYDKQSAFVRGRIQGLLIKVQVVNVFAGIAFFYLAPVLITPKANLAIFFIISTVLLFVWRMIMFPVLSVSRAQSAILIGSGDDIDDLYTEINANSRYGITFKARIEPNSSSDFISQTEKVLHETGALIIVADLHDGRVESNMRFLYSQVFSGKQVMDASRLYEAIFDRIPLSLVGERWLVENASTAFGNRRVYDTLKRLMDIVVSSLIGIIPIVLLPFIYIAVKIDDRGGIFIKQKRIGQRGKIIDVAKFRSMTANDGGKYDNGKTALKVTRLGKFIRLTRIDELPQLWSVINGDQSLIGPRPELPDLVKVYEKEIPYYNVRHLIKPGLSGWAQIYHRAHPHHAVAVDDTRDKLSYDLYYIKNRSLILDLRIAMQTIRALLSRQGV